ncbi:hypothetical protein [Spongiactinospora sp. TRM90649]|uniref:hypothetical protein n=1 Tax=Spongiactinospora sp. TRM90649 TaxID=3031114 RepID=UPI0023F67117|nr:hypothetical protein [Spongiactinospora sp. TRM90649]MDF5759185.1 hypothetical protein [Spongiactinospora sp. TRM90649]
MTTALPPPEPPREPTPAEVDQVLAAMEEDLAVETEPAVPEVSGETKRVLELRERVAEAHLLAELQEDETPFTLDTKRVGKLRRRTYEAARLYQLAQHPAALAYRDARVRRLTTGMTMAAAGIALAVSSIGVQASVDKALKLEEYSAGWWGAFGVEVILSLPLLAAVGVQAYSAMRGRVVDRKSPEGRKLFRVELALLGLTLTLNCWPAFTVGFDPLTLIVHSLGPVAAVLAVWVLPTLWKILSDLPAPWLSTAPGTTPVRPQYSGNAQDQYDVSTAPVRVLADHIRSLIDTGQMDPNPSVHKIRKALGVGSDKATEVQKLIAGGTP